MGIKKKKQTNYYSRHPLPKCLKIIIINHFVGCLSSQSDYCNNDYDCYNNHLLLFIITVTSRVAFQALRDSRSAGLTEAEMSGIN